MTGGDIEIDSEQIGTGGQKVSEESEPPENKNTQAKLALQHQDAL